MIVFDKVNLNFDDKQILQDFSLKFEENSINCILAPNGAGKTTLLNIIAGAANCTSGSVTIPKTVSYVFQDEALIPQKTARQNLEFVLKSLYPDKIQCNQIVDYFLHLAGLFDDQHLFPVQMSGGMRQRLCLVRAFAYPSEVLLMDEPFSALDISRQQEILSAFLHLYQNNKRTVIFVTHNIDEAVLCGDFVYVFGHKPMKLLEKIKIDVEFSKRKVYNDQLTAIKNQIYLQTEKW